LNRQVNLKRFKTNAGTNEGPLVGLGDEAGRGSDATTGYRLGSPSARRADIPTDRPCGDEGGKCRVLVPSCCTRLAEPGCPANWPNLV